MEDTTKETTSIGGAAGAGPRREAEIFIDGIADRRPVVPTNWTELEAGARQAMSEQAWAYVAGGAGEESTPRVNREAFSDWRIVPRVLRDVSRRSSSIELLGRKLQSPLLLSPVGVLDLVHRRADLEVATAAKHLGIPMIFSNQASVAMEKVADELGTTQRWFQLYWSADNDLVASFVERAETCGCEAIVVTLDTPMLGWRPRDLNLAKLPFLEGRGIAQYTSDPVFRRAISQSSSATPAQRPPLGFGAIRTLFQQIAHYPGSLREKLTSSLPRRAVQHFLATYSRTNLTWKDLAFLRQRTDLPILLKGILHPDDALAALDFGINGIVVSNHGGRQIDGEIASLAALPKVVQAVAGRIPVLFDSGIRTGSDIFKALALGASAVCIGRPYVYGLAIAGQLGVQEVLDNLLAELDLTMGLSGCANIEAITADTLESTSHRGS